MGAAVRTCEVVIENPLGSTVRTLLRPGTGWVEAGPAWTPFPAEYGFLPGTLNPADGEPVDVLVIGAGPTFPGSRYRVRPIGLLLRQDGDHKVLAVPHTSEYVSPLQDVAEVDPEVRQRIEAYFSPHFELLGWRGARWAEEWIAVCQVWGEG